ncbi:MAG: TetR/AcrR family transcriptional regulator [Dehalococcoidia bacterium]|nr:TetR/AcrR family transcriptional regulator [Dehalococcoidia bacterium]
METPVRRKNIPPQRRRQIFEAAAELFSHSGYHGVTVDAIARRAGISKGNLYWYFNSKREIFQLLVDQVIEKLFIPVVAEMEKEETPRERLRALARSCLASAEANPEAIHLMWQIGSQPELKEQLSVEYSLWMGPFIHYLTPLFTELGEKEPEGIAMLYAFTLDSLMFVSVISPDFYDKDKLMAALEEKFFSSRGERDV